MTIKTWQRATVSNKIPGMWGNSGLGNYLLEKWSLNDRWVYQNHSKNISKMQIPGPKPLRLINDHNLLCGRQDNVPVPLFDFFWTQNHRTHQRGSLSALERSKHSFLTNNLCGSQNWVSGSQDHVTFKWSLLVLLSTRASDLSSFLWGFQSQRWGLTYIRLRPLRRWGGLREIHFPFSSSGRIQRGQWSLLGNASIRCPGET